MLRTISARVGAIFGAIVFYGWLIAGWTLDLIGRSTVVDDYNQLIDRLPAVLQWLFSTPWQVPAGLAAAITIFLVWASWPRSNEPQVQAAKLVAADAGAPPPQPASAVNPLDSFFQKKVIRLSDLLISNDIWIRGKTFQDCIIQGPAVVTLDPKKPFLTQFCTFWGPLDAIFIVVTGTRDLFGVVGLSDCRFERCEFRQIGFIGSQALKDKMAAGSTHVD
jgi:hypothetical protein